MQRLFGEILLTITAWKSTHDEWVEFFLASHSDPIDNDAIKKTSEYYNGVLFVMEFQICQS